MATDEESPTCSVHHFSCMTGRGRGRERELEKGDVVHNTVPIDEFNTDCFELFSTVEVS